MFENFSLEKQKEIENLKSEYILSLKCKDKSGIRQNNITYIKPAFKKNNRIFWWVICDCGNIFTVRADNNRKFCDECNQKANKVRLKGKIKKDLTNKTFGYLTALYPIDKYQNKHIYWHCKCKCGKEIDVIGNSLLNGNTQSCGCIKRENGYFAKEFKKDLTNQHFGKLTVLEDSGYRQYGKVLWKCQCECGNITYVNTSTLISGNTVSCGCQTTSIGEKNIQDILLKNNILFQKQYNIKELNNKKFDFAILDNNNQIKRFIEFDGQQHFKEITGSWGKRYTLAERIKMDKEKNEYALSHNIPLVRIPYWERDNITLEMIMGDQYLVK